MLLMILLVGFTVPTLAIGHIHPVSFVLVVVYLFSIKWLADTHEKPMWLPRMTRGTVSENRRPVRKIISSEKLSMFSLFFFYAVLVGVAGWLIAMSGVELVNRTGLSASLMGGIFVAVATSLPELVVAITAIRMGALTLAVGDVIGGNTFDTLFIAVSDFLFREGSIFNFIATEERVWLVSAMLMNAVLMLGLMYRERKGFANIGLESLVILLVYLLTLTYLGFSVSY